MVVELIMKIGFGLCAELEPEFHQQSTETPPVQQRRTHQRVPKRHLKSIKTTPQQHRKISENPGKSRKIPEDPGKSRKIPETPGEHYKITEIARPMHTISARKILGKFVKSEKIMYDRPGVLCKNIGAFEMLVTYICVSFAHICCTFEVWQANAKQHRADDLLGPKAWLTSDQF